MLVDTHRNPGFHYLPAKGNTIYAMPGFRNFYGNGHFASAQNMDSLIFMHNNSFAVIRSGFSKTNFWKSGKKCSTKSYHPCLQKFSARLLNKVHSLSFVLNKVTK